ncbi:biotin--[acetyl-CoA-carboxylase] ligase [Chloroflexota bacterium]
MNDITMAEDNLFVASITRDLGTRFVGQKVIYFPSLTSTMEVARKEAQKGAPEGTVIIADKQTAGKGRIGRAWLTPKGNIAFSIILHPSLTYLSSLIMLASLAVVYSIERIAGLKAWVKWPNDILINGRKACGILIESDVHPNSVNYAIIGIGINVNLRLADFPWLESTATSLSDELGREVQCFSLIRRVLVEVENLYLDLLAGKPLYQEWRDNLITLGKQVRVKTAEIVYEGVAESVARDGSLLLRGRDGNLIEILAGDVTLRD